jgi:tetrahydromethanopterin S-methyltransferase subunit G
VGEPDNESAVMAGLEFLGRNALKLARGAGKVLEVPARSLRAGTGYVFGIQGTGEESFAGGREVTPEDLAGALPVSDKPLPSELFIPIKERGFRSVQSTGLSPTLYSPKEITTEAIRYGYDPLILAGLPGVKQALGVGAKAIGATARGAGEAIQAGAKIADIATGVRVASPIVEGTATAAKATKQTVQNVAKMIKDRFKPTVAKDIAKIEQTASKIGIDPKDLPAVLEFGPSSSVTKMEKTLAEGLGGESIINKHYDTRIAIDNAVDSKVASLGGGEVKDTLQAGKKIVKDYDKAVDRLFRDVTVTNRSILEKNPGMVMTNNASKKIDAALDDIEKMARRRAGYESVDMVTGEVKKVAGTQIGAQKQQAQNLIDRVNAIRGTKNKTGQYDYDSFLEATQGMGADAHKMQSQYNIAIDTAKEQELYKKLTDIRINDIGDQLGSEVANTLKANNKKMSEFFKKTDTIKKSALSGKSEEKIFESLVKSGDFKTIQNMRETIPEAFTNARATFLDSLISRNEQGLINHITTRNNLAKNKTKLSMMFDADELADIDDFTSLGARMGSPVMSTSGTGGSIAVREGVKDVAKEAALKAQLDILKKRARENFGETLTPTQRMARGIAEPSGIKKLYSASMKPGSAYKKTRLIRAEGLKKIGEE